MTTLAGSTSASRAAGRVGRNAAILAATSLLCKAGSLAVVPFILRAFTPVHYGMYSAAFAYAGLLGIVAYFGMNQIVVRDISTGDRPKGWVIFHCSALRGMLLVPAAGVLVVLGLVKGFSPAMWLLASLAFAVMALDAVTGTLKASLQAAERFGLVAALDAVRKCAQWGMAIAVILAGAGIAVLAGGVVAAAVITLAAAALITLRPRDFAGVNFAPRYAAGMLRLAAPMGISAAFVAALDNVDIWLLDALADFEAVAVYKAANVFKPVFIAQALVWAFMPIAFRLGRASRARLAAASAGAARFLVVSGAGIAIFIVCGADRIVPFLAGRAYVESVGAFQVMGMTLPFVFAGFLYLHMLTAVDRQILAVGIFAAGLAVNVAADVILIPRLGPAGAMLGTLCAEVVMFAAAIAVVWRVVGRPLDGASLRTAAAVAAGAAAAIFTRSAGIADMGIGALAVMGACLVASGAVSASDVALVKAVFTRRV